MTSPTALLVNSLSESNIFDETNSNVRVTSVIDELTGKFNLN
ncbi:hypothetical protein [uncultured Leptotrichia sp.]|nr:hypothetical protein [uncultured Leptotrichia sp.]